MNLKVLSSSHTVGEIFFHFVLFCFSLAPGSSNESKLMK